MRGGDAFWKLKWLAKEVMKQSSVDVFKNTRQRNYTEARAVFNFFARNIYGHTYLSIKKFYNINGKPMNHATIIHSLKTFDANMKFSDYMRDLYESIDPTMIYREGIKAKSAYLINQLTNENASIAYEYVKAIYDDQQRLEQMGEQVVQTNMV